MTYHNIRVDLIGFPHEVTLGLDYAFFDAASYLSLLDSMLLYFDTKQVDLSSPHYKVTLGHHYRYTDTNCFDKYDFSINVASKADLAEIVRNIHHLSSDRLTIGHFSLQQSSYCCSFGAVVLVSGKTSTDSMYLNGSTFYSKPYGPRYN